jgi:putative membrane protein
MKKNMYLAATFLLATSLMFSCGRKTETETDSKEIAEEQNEAKHEDSNIEKDTDFAVDAADAGLLEVRLGELAQTNATSQQVKEFGQMMVTDHSKANDELKSLTAQKNISLPGALSEKCQKKYDELAEKKGADFDKAFMKAMVDDHEDVVKSFKKEAEDGNDPDIKAWASGKVAALEHHLESAKTTRDAVEKSK